MRLWTVLLLILAWPLAAFAQATPLPGTVERVVFTVALVTLGVVVTLVLSLFVLRARRARRFAEQTRGLAPAGADATLPDKTDAG
jgi:threonine/homoserine/homoserine lactone efflux protein